MEVRLQFLAIVASSGLVLIVFELLRRRRLVERYALLWLMSALALLLLSVWTGLLETLSSTLGIAYPPNALFMVAFAFVLLLLLHFSIAISRLSGETKVLAQEIARLDREVRVLKELEEPEPQEAPLAGLPTTAGEYEAVRAAGRQPLGAAQRSSARTPRQ
jgi:hypothetical protein